MKKLVLLMAFLPLLTGCPSQEEVNSISEEIATKRAVAVQVMLDQDFSLDGLLKIHDYFFNFSEKVHLMNTEPEARKMMQSYITSKGGARAFCDNFVFPLSYWQTLETFCQSSGKYKCSPEMEEYRFTVLKFLDLIGNEAKQALAREPRCQ